MIIVVDKHEGDSLVSFSEKIAFDKLYQAWIQIGRELVDLFPKEVENYPKDVMSFDELIEAMSNVKELKELSYDIGVMIPIVKARSEEEAMQKVKEHLANKDYSLDVIAVGKEF